MAKAKARVKKKPVKGRSEFVLELAAQLKRRREALKLDYRAVSIRCGYRITPEMIREYEMGMEPRLSKAILLCVALDVPLSTLLPERAATVPLKPATGRALVEEGYFSNPAKE